MTALYIRKRFTGGPLAGLSFDTAMPGFQSPEEAAGWARKHRDTPVKVRGFGGPYVVELALFQDFRRG